MCNFWNRLTMTHRFVRSCILLTAVSAILVHAGSIRAEGGNGSAANVSSQAAASYYQVQGDLNVDSYLNSILNPLGSKTSTTTSTSSPFGSKTYTTSTKSSPFGSKTYTTTSGFSKFGTTSSGFFNLSGNWRGYLALYGKAREFVSATVAHNGSRIVITTSSHQAYGKKFSGSINSSGFILAYDQRTGQDWTTHSGPASKNRIDLYDYVLVERYGYRYLDRLYLER